MKHYSFLTYFVLSTLANLSAQGLKRSEVYSMQKGDVFVFSVEYDSKKRVDIDTILNRKEVNLDSVVFSIKTSHFVFEPQLNNWIRTFEYSSKSFGQLSQPFFNKFTQCDTVIKSGDSTFTYGGSVLKDTFYFDSCGNAINERFESFWTALSGSGESHDIAYIGVGSWVNWEYFDSNQRDFYTQKLLYFNRNGTTCGDPRILKIINNDIGIERVIKPVKIYPNPGSATIQIEWEEDGTYTITNNIGEQIQFGNYSNTLIDISQLSSGIYHLILNSNGKVFYQTIVKE